MKSVKIRGMSCNHCRSTVEKAISGIRGVRNVSVNLENGEATFEATEEYDPQALKAAVAKAGFESE